MSFWTERRGRQLIALVLMIAMFVLAGALVAHAASTPVQPAMAAVEAAQGDATPTAAPVDPPEDPPVSEEGAEPAVMVGTLPTTATATLTPTLPSPTKTPTPLPPANVIVNGGFEDGFAEGQGVGIGWGRFQNGDVFAGWYDDTWFKVVYEGEHAQLLELKDATASDRYVGIFQTVDVVPHAEYILTLHGLVRSDEGSVEASNYGYRLRYGIDLTGGTNWQASTVKWVELPWDEQPREDPTGGNVYRMEMYTATVKAETNKLTLFIQGWKKWLGGGEGNYDVDGVSLVGPQPGAKVKPTSAPDTVIPETGFALLDNPVLVVASAALLVVLAGGAVWGLSRRRA